MKYGDSNVKYTSNDKTFSGKTSQGGVNAPMGKKGNSGVPSVPKANYSDLNPAMPSKGCKHGMNLEATVTAAGKGLKGYPNADMGK